MTYVLEHQGPLQAFAAKLSCRRLWHSRYSLHDIVDQLKNDPWEQYIAAVFIEDTGAARLLCSLCRKKHPRAFFPATTIGHSGIIRSCQSTDAIEFAQSKLEMLELSRILHEGPCWYNPPNDRYSGYAYPIRSFGRQLDLVRERARSVGTGRPSVHSPYKYDSHGWEHSYQMRQCIRLFERGAVLISNLGFGGLEIPEALYKQVSESRRKCLKDFLPRFISSFAVQGGLWVCPHIPMTGRLFCDELSRGIWFAVAAQPKPTNPMCRVCGTRCTLYVEEVDAGQNAEPYMFSVKVEVEKLLGKLEDLFAGIDAHGSDLLAPQLSRRICHT